MSRKRKLDGAEKKRHYSHESKKFKTAEKKHRGVDVMTPYDHEESIVEMSTKLIDGIYVLNPKNFAVVHKKRPLFSTN
jgi:hypothetical protein